MALWLVSATEGTLLLKTVVDIGHSKSHQIFWKIVGFNFDKTN